MVRMARMRCTTDALGGKPCRAAISAHSSIKAVDETAAARRDDVADRGAHQAGQRRRRGGDEHPFVPHVLQDRRAELRIETRVRQRRRDRLDARRARAVARAEGQAVQFVEMQDAPSASSVEEIRQRPPSVWAAPKRRSSAVEMMHAVEQRQDRGRRPDRRREGLHRAVEIIGLAAQKDEIEGLAQRLRLDDRRRRRDRDRRAGCGSKGRCWRAARRVWRARER